MDKNILEEYIQPSDKTLFGQYLVEVKKINAEIRDKALEIQNKESSSNLKQSHRLLGQILYEEFNVFRDRLELNKYLHDFQDFKQEVERLRFEARMASKKK